MQITSENFSEHFFNVRDHKPRKGDCIARFRAIAELIDGFEKRQMIELLKKPNTAVAIGTMMRRLAHAVEEDVYKVPQQMGADLLEGMTEEEVAKKPYEFMMELYFYTFPENVPQNDPNWAIINIVDNNDFIKVVEENNEQPSI
jgi:hypothetical protein